MLLIPGGEFAMGSVKGQKDEFPIHKVRVDSFYLGRSEVTIWEYLQCVKVGGCSMPLWWNRRFFDQETDERKGSEWLELPVTGVSWQDALNYCRWKGEGYRLPTEAEWEYAARAGSFSEYFWGETMDSAALYAVIEDGLDPVMSKRPNKWGLFDMTGNAWEWCQDIYDKTYYRTSPSRNPSGSTEGKKRVYRSVRGGGWNEYSWNLRSANRSYGEEFRRFEGVGFRICRSAK